MPEGRSPSRDGGRPTGSEPPGRRNCRSRMEPQRTIRHLIHRMILKRGPDLPSSEITDERHYVDRREFMRLTCAASLAAATGPLIQACGRRNNASGSERNTCRMARSRLAACHWPMSSRRWCRPTRNGTRSTRSPATTISTSSAPGKAIRAGLRAGSGPTSGP